MEHRDFDKDLPASEPAGSFTLGGRTWRVRSKDDTSIGFLNVFTGEDGKVKAGPFFRATIHRDDVDAFLAMTEEPDGPLTKEKLAPVMDYITALALGRPTTPVTPSSSGSKRTGRKSAAGSSSRATTRARSTRSA